MTDHHKDEALRLEAGQHLIDSDFNGNDIEASVKIERRAHDGTLWDFYLHIEAGVHGSHYPGDREEPPSYPEVEITRVCEDDKLDVDFELTDREEGNINALLYEAYENFWASY